MVLFSFISEAETIHAYHLDHSGAELFIMSLIAINMGLGVTLMWQHCHWRAS